MKNQKFSIGNVIVCFVLIFSLGRPAGVLALDIDNEATLPSANLPPTNAITSSLQDKNIIWQVELDVQDASSRTIEFTASYNAAFLRHCIGMRTSSDLASNGTMST